MSRPRASAFVLALTTAVVVFTAHRLSMRELPDHRADRPVFSAERLAGAESERRGDPQSLPHRSDSETTRRADPDAGTASVVGAVGRMLDAPETYRNTSMLIAIRDAGFVCADIIAADAGAEGIPAWRVVCDGALVYLVSVDESGGLAVDPVPYAEGYRYFDPESGPPWLEQQQGPPRSIEQRPPPR